jgi:hypothetical protein
MATSDSDTSYYIRIRGRVLGPYSLKQLNTLRVRGQFSQTNEISLDGQLWESAATLDSLFGAATRTRKKAGAAADSTELRMRSEDPASPRSSGSSELAAWHYSAGEKQLGPVPLAELKQLLVDGRLSMDDLVWKDGMPEWLPASELAELAQIKTRKRRSSTAATSGDSDNDVDASTDGLARHFLDYVLIRLRSLVSDSFFLAVEKISIEIGRYAIYLAILLNVVFSFLIAIKLKRLDIGLFGTGFAATLIVLSAASMIGVQYGAIKLCGALRLTIRATTLRMSSTAFLDILAMLALAQGVVGLMASVILWIQIQQIICLVIGIVLFLGLELLGLMLLHPKAVGITTTSRASTGEEAIAILSLFLMLPARFVPAIFAMGSVASVIGTLTAFYLFLGKSPTFAWRLPMPDSQIVALVSCYAALVAAAFPFLMYLSFVFAYLVVDFVRSVLILPDRVDQLALSLVSRPELSDGEAGSAGTVTARDASQ